MKRESHSGLNLLFLGVLAALQFLPFSIPTQAKDPTEVAPNAEFLELTPAEQKQREKDADKLAREIQDRFFAEAEKAQEAINNRPIKSLSDMFSPEQLKLLEEVGELYERAQAYADGLLKDFDARYANIELENVKRYSDIFAMNSHAEERFFDQFGGAKLDKLKANIELFRAGNIEDIRKQVAMAHLMDRLERSELKDVETAHGYAKITHIDGKVVIRVIHRASRTAFLMLPHGIDPQSKHLALYGGRQLFDAKVPTLAEPNGDRHKIGLRGTVYVWVDDDANIQKMQVNKKPKVFTRAWFKAYKNATYVKPDKENLIFGAVCGATQVTLSTCLGSYSGLAPAAVTFAWGGGIGAYNKTYRNWRNRGYSVALQMLKHSAITFSFNYAFYIANQGFSFFDPSNALGFYNPMTHIQVLLNGLLMIPARSAWELWGQVRDRLRLGLDYFKIQVGDFKIRAKSLRNNAVFYQMVLANIPWLARIYDLKHPDERWVFNDHLYLTYGKAWMFASIFVAILAAGTDLTLRANSERYKNSAAYKETQEYFRESVNNIERTILKCLGIGFFIPKEKHFFIRFMDWWGGKVASGINWIKAMRKQGTEVEIKLGDRELTDAEMSQVHDAAIEEVLHPKDAYSLHPRCDAALLNK
ncbi:MAG: hypothetical protein KA116_05905 [Proteobacteria bacterium]|nr:hypothetical protein [Pseudomonadota bacterium]